jgi:serine/threonine protein kinase
MNHSPLAHHPNIIELYGYGWRLKERRPAPYIVLEYGDQGSLRHYLKNSRSLSLQAKLIFAGDVACGLTALHQCGIVHGDVKLDNVIVFPSLDRPSGSIAKICDFGHSLLLDSDSERQLKYVGTTLSVRLQAYISSKTD